MNGDVHCPRCNQSVAQKPSCQHLRWRPEQGGPIDFALSLLKEKPVPGISLGRVPEGWWESQFDWLFDRITARLDVIDGHCFADSGQLDRLWLDLKHKLAPESVRELTRSTL